MSLSVLFPTTHPSLTQLFSTMLWVTPSSLVCHAMPCHDESICLVRRLLSLVVLTVVCYCPFQSHIPFSRSSPFPVTSLLWKSKEKRYSLLHPHELISLWI